MTIKMPSDLTDKFTYIDCGSSGDSSNLLLKNFKDACYVGFDPGLKEVSSIGDRSICFPVAVANETKQMEFHRTKNPNCSSFFKPDHEFLSVFEAMDNFFEVKDVITLQTVSLDEYLPKNGVTDIDFIELDTQGAELEILQGCEGFLRSNIMGARVEVEFARMYIGQPLFGDVDSFFRRLGFQLFDLDRYHLKRASSPAGIMSREQLVWGQAIYLRDFRLFSAEPERLKQKLSKLAIIASHYGFHSYAVEIVNHLVHTNGIVDSEEKELLKVALVSYLSELKNDKFLKWAHWVDTPPLSKRLRHWWPVFSKFYEACRFLIERQRYFWKD